MSRHWPRGVRASQCIRIGLFAAALASTSAALAVSCTTQAQMSDADRTALEQAARQLGGQVQAGDAAALKAASQASLAAQFDGIAEEIQSIAPSIRSATLTVDHLYSLNAADLTAAEDSTQFFCGSADGRVVTFTIPQIPPGRYAIAILRATGVMQPQQITLVLAAQPGPAAQWKLAGFFLRPITSAGHDGVWYWSRAREYARLKFNWNAYFYYQTAASLLAPVNFLSTPNLDKLLKEQAAITPETLPGAQPMKVTSNGQTYEITSLRTDGSLGGLDMVINYRSPDNSDPVATRSRNIDVMKALLAQYPEMRGGFHGMWVYAQADKQQPFAIEMPMDQFPPDLPNVHH